MNAQYFLTFFLQYSKNFCNANPNWLDLYYQDKNWTERFISRPTSSSDKSEFGNKFLSFSEDEFKYRTEDGTIDLAFSRKSNFYNNEIETLDKSKISDFFWPKQYDLILEHENNIKCSWQELLKLSYISAKLKVLITYNTKNDLKTMELENRIMHDNLLEVVKNDIAFDEYLLLIGSVQNLKITWRYFIEKAPNTVSDEKQ